MALLTAQEVINGKEGQIFATINGLVENLAEVKSLAATVTKKKTSFPVLGFRGERNKANGFTGAGTMSIYYNTTKWAKIMENYVKNGIDTYFSIIVVNSDPTSSIGTQRIRLDGCNLNELVVAKVDVGSDVLEVDVPFTFDDYTILDEFTRG